MTTREALLKAVLANPDDDLPRLVYADWLEENDKQVAADYIRIACAGDAVTTLEYSRRHWREVDDFRDVVKYGMGYDYSRGFVSGVHCSLANWLKHGPAVVREHPVAKVNFTTDQHGEIIAPTGDGNFVIAALRDEEDAGQGFVPFSLMNFLKLFGGRHSGEYYMIALFDTRDEAESALSSAAIQWAKSQPV